MPNSLQTATFAGGCFWCTEAIFQRLKGVESVQSGYTGGQIPNPTYEDISTGNSGHAEAVQITFDPTVIRYETLLEVFFKLHDPTTLNQQGADIGTQYRSAVFFHDEEQKKSAEEAIKKVNESHIYSDSVVTEVVPATEFYNAEQYHDNYYNNNKSQGYCSIVIDPKIHKLFKEFKQLVKDE